jgi:TolA-binding protein
MTHLLEQKTRCRLSRDRLGIVLCLLLLLILSSLAMAHAAAKGQVGRGGAMHAADRFHEANKAGRRQERMGRQQERLEERREVRTERRQQRMERRQDRAERRRERTERKQERIERHKEQVERKREQIERRKEWMERRNERAERRKERRKREHPNGPLQPGHRPPDTHTKPMDARTRPTETDEGTPPGKTVASLGHQPRGKAGRLEAKGKANRPAPVIAKEVVLSLPLDNAARIESEIAHSYRLTIVERNDLALIGQRIVRCRFADGRSLAAVLAAMREDRRIVSAQPNYIHQSQGVTENQYALEKLGIHAAHAMATGAGVIIAVIDTGIDVSHPALASAVIGSFDATGENPPLADPHGTAIAGIIAAHGGIEGVAPQAKLLDVRVFAPAPDGEGPAATTMSLLRALQWSADNGARIVNLSLTGGRDELVGRAVEAMLAQQIIIVAAAGNNGADAPEAYPAAFAGVIAVTATDAGDALYDAANHGAYITIAAPGVDVIAPAFNAAYAIHTGTSFAAAHVSGVIALMLERQPTLTAPQIRAALQAKAKDLGPPGTDDQFGAGRVSALAVLQ